MSDTSRSRTVGWIGWSLCATYLLYKIIIQTSVSAMAPELIAEFNISEFRVGIVSSAFFYTYIFCQVPAGMLVDRFGARRILTISATCFALSCFIFAIAHTTYILEITRLLMGAFATPAVCSALYIASKWLPTKRFAIIAGLTDTIGMLGAAIAEVSLSFGIDNLGWRASIAVAGKLGLALALLSWLFVRDRPAYSPEPEYQTQRRLRSAFVGLYNVIKLPQVWMCSIFGGLLLIQLITFGGKWCTPFLMTKYHINFQSAAFATSLIFWGEMIGAPISGWYSDYIGKRQPVMFIGCIASIIILLIILFIPDIPLWDMYGLLFGLGFFTGPYVLSFAIVRELTPELVRATGMAFTNTMCVFFGYILMEPLLNWLINVQQFTLSTTVERNIDLATYQSAFLSFVVIQLLAFATSAFVKETDCDYQEWRSDKTYL